MRLQPDGPGVYTYVEGPIQTFTCGYVQGIPEGYGIEQMRDGSVLKGIWKNGKKHGTFYFTNVHDEKYKRKYVRVGPVSG